MPGKKNKKNKPPKIPMEKPKPKPEDIPNPFLTLDADGHKVYTVSGKTIHTIQDFYTQADYVMRPRGWGHNLDAFNDILTGWFTAPDEPYTIVWKDHQLSKERLEKFDVLVEIMRATDQNRQLTLVLD